MVVLKSFGKLKSEAKFTKRQWQWNVAVHVEQYIFTSAMNLCPSFASKYILLACSAFRQKCRITNYMTAVDNGSSFPA